MTSTETRSRTISFGLGTKTSRLPYGAFFDNGREVSGSTCFTSTLALSDLDKLVAKGLIPEEYKEAIAEEIRACNLPEKEPYHGPFTLERHPESGVIGLNALVLQGADGTFFGEPILSKSMAREIIRGAISKEVVRTEEESELLKAVEESGLPENRGFGMGISLEELLGGFLGATPERKGPFTFRTANNSKGILAGNIYDADDDPMSRAGYTSKAEARYEISGSLRDGSIHEDDHDSLLKQVEESTLPDAWNLVITFAKCNCGERALHGKLYEDGESLGNSVFSMSQARPVIARLIEIGVIDEAKAEELRGEMRKVGLPETFGM